MGGRIICKNNLKINYRSLFIMPSLTIDEVLQFSKWKSNVFIETGTYLGETISNVVNNFDTVYSIELSSHYAQKAIEKFKNNPKVKIIQGDSSVVIGDLADKVNDSVFFWLDGHWSSGDTARGDLDCPLLEEVKQINNKYKNKCILAIDDVRLFGTNITEDWSNITRDSVLNIVKDRLVSCDYFPSHLNSEDRMVLHLRDL
jgi:hypothetical protein